MTKSKFVYAVRKDRLGARIGNLVSAWEFAQKTGRTLMLNWEDYADLQSGSFSFFDFFGKIDKTSENFDLVVDTGRRSDFQKNIKNLQITPISKHLNKSVEYFASIEEAISFNQTVRYNFDCRLTNEVDLRPSLFQSLGLNEDIKISLAKIFDKLKIEDCIAVHIRMGDILHLLSDIPEDGPLAEKRSLVASFVSRFAPQQAYFSAIEEFPNSTIFIFSDSDAARSALKCKFGSRAVDVRGDLENLGLTDAQIAFCEMQIIMRTTEVICTRSAFASVPCLLSNCKMHPVFPYIDSKELWQAIDTQIRGRVDQIELIEILLERYRRFTPKIIDDLTSLVRKDFGSEIEYGGP